MALKISRGEDWRTRCAGVTNGLVQVAHVEQCIVMDEMSMRRQLFTSVRLFPAMHPKQPASWSTKISSLDEMTDAAIVEMIVELTGKED